MDQVPTCEHGRPLPEFPGGGYLLACFCTVREPLRHEWGCTCGQCEWVAP